MWRRRLVLASCVLSATCEAETTGWGPTGDSYAHIAGKVTDSGGRAVSDVLIHGYAKPGRSSDGGCEFWNGEVHRRYTFPDGMYRARIHDPVRGAPCKAHLFLWLQPPEESGLEEMAIDDREIAAEESTDPEVAENPVIVDAAFTGVDARPVPQPIAPYRIPGHRREVIIEVLGIVEYADGAPISGGYVESYTMMGWDCFPLRGGGRRRTASADSLGVSGSRHVWSTSEDRGCVRIRAWRSRESFLDRDAAAAETVVTFLVPGGDVVRPDTIIVSLVLPEAE